MTDSNNAVEPALTEVSAGAVHALNNVLAVLFAASSYLEEPDDAGSVERARQAVENACKAGQAVSAGLAILGLDTEALKSAAEISRNSSPLESDDFERIFDAVREVGGVRFAEGSGRFPDAVIPLDRENLQALLICAATALRREFGRDIDLVCDARMSGGQMVFELRSEVAQAGRAGFKHTARHPCSIAIERAEATFPHIGCVLHRPAPGAIRIAVPATGAA